MAKGKLWTPQELTILKECVKNKRIKKDGYKEAAKKLGRAEKACSEAYCRLKRGEYNKLQKRKKDTKLSKEEVKGILYSNIQKNPGNLQEAFKITAKQTGRSKTALEQAYYSKTSYLSRHKNKKSFILFSKEKMAANSKIFNSAVAEKTTKQKIKHFIAELFNITTKDL